MNTGMLITIAIALVVGVAICLFAVRMAHHKLVGKLEPPKKNGGH